MIWTIDIINIDIKFNNNNNIIYYLDYDVWLLLSTHRQKIHDLNLVQNIVEEF